MSYVDDFVRNIIVVDFWMMYDGFVKQLSLHSYLLTIKAIFQSTISNIKLVLATNLTKVRIFNLKHTHNSC